MSNQTYWAIDCASPAHLGLLDQVHTALGVYPSVVGRYLQTTQGVCTGLSAQEVAYLHSRGIALLIVYSGAPQGQLGGNYSQGYGFGQDAINLAYALGVPKGTAIYLDIEADATPSSAVMNGWAANLERAGYVAGFYANPQHATFSDPYGQIVLSRDLVIWSNEPEWLPASAPLPPGPTWAPAAPPGYDAQVVAWQYSEGNLGGLVDYDLLSERGYQFCWRAPTPAHVSVSGALKFAPDHASQQVVDTHGQHVYLWAGTYVLTAGPTSATKDPATGEYWLHIQLAAPDEQIAGWFLQNRIAAGV